MPFYSPISIQRTAIGSVLAVLLSVTLIASQAGAAEDGSLEQCVGLQKKIDRYTRLRRSGGNAQQMERWRDARRRYQEVFTDLRCRRHGRKLRASD